jgi:hypothetical protein
MNRIFLVSVFFTVFVLNPSLIFSQATQNSLTGQISDVSGNPIEGAKVEIYSAKEIGTQKDEVFSDQNGVFELRKNIEYPIRILVSHPDYEGKKVEFESPPGYRIQVELSSSLRNFVYRGRLLSKPNSQPIPGAEIAFDDDDIAIKDLGNTVVTTNAGEFELPLRINLNEPEREFFISFEKNGYLDSRIKVSYNDEFEGFNNIELVPQNTRIRLTGRIVDIANNEPIELATIQILSANDDLVFARPIGQASDINGEFDFNRLMAVPYKIRISHVSYQTEEIVIRKVEELNRRIRLRPRNLSGEDIIVTAEMVNSEDLKKPQTIDRISTVDIQQVASFNSFDLVSTLREVDVATQSMNLQSVSTRGFNASANPRFLQLTDGVDNVAPGLGFPVGNLMGPSELDIASVDLIVGSSTARYGSSALNGVLLTSSKSPFENQGFAATIKSGFHNINLGGESPLAAAGDGVFDASFRYATAFRKKLGFKISGTIIQGEDWKANNYKNIGGGGPNLSIRATPSYSGVNTYGDEGFVILPVGVDEERRPDSSLVPVHRTGYREEDLVDYDIATQKISSALSYKFDDDILFTLEGRYGNTNTLYTSDSRIRLENFRVLQLKADLNYKSAQFIAYRTSQNSGSSYNVNYLADQLITDAKSDFDWYRDYRLAYKEGFPLFGVPRLSFNDARSFADRPFTLLQTSTAQARFEPGTARYDSALTALKNEASFERGAGIRDNSILYHFDGVNTFEEIGVTTGASYRFYDIESEGTLFPDTTGNDITNFEFGAFASYEGSVIDDKLSFIAAIRVDKNENFAYMSSQQLGINFEASEKQFFRISYQRGFRYPTVREQFLNTNIGKARLMGGLSLVTDPYRIQGNSFFEQDVIDYNTAITFDVEEREISRTQAEIRNLPILEDAIVTSEDLFKIKPEKVNSIEIGSRRLFSDNLYLDLNYFISFYKDFIGTNRFIKPRTSPSVDLYSAASQSINSTQSDRFYIYGNSGSTLIAQGFAFDLSYSSGRFFTGVNGTLSNLISDSDDPIVPGYNTPPFKFNFDWGNRELITNVGFKMTFRYRAAHDWESSFLDGKIESYGHFDFQFNIKMPRLRSMVKTGITNFGRESYYDVFGGPKIGSILFMSLTYSPTIF